VLAAALAALGALSAAAWLAIALRPARSWDLRPVGEGEPWPAAPQQWPRAAIVVPAHDEADQLPRTLPALLAQDYPGEWRVVVVDDRSSDGTAAVARSLGDSRLQVVDGEALPPRWAGKVWAMAQGVAAAPDAAYLLLTDADITHVPSSLRRLVAESERAGLGLNSRMARLRTVSAPERLLIPPFLFFFNLLYPMRLVNRPGRTAAAAGGCVLVRRSALEAAGGMEAIRSEVIDDVNLAAAIKRAGASIRLSVSRGDVTSLREYRSLRTIWRMVKRTAFTELRFSWLLLAGTLLGLCLLFLAPPLVAVAGVGSFGLAGGWRLLLVALGVAGWAVMAMLLAPTERLYGLSPLWALTFPLGGLLYGAMTLDSAIHHGLRRRPQW
jgi:hopene-associated glycosyltransferase HpnB